jgi:multiple sugar transport system substrate-binding protein
MGTMKLIRAYLTAFLKHTPGLLLILALAACDGSQSPGRTNTPASLTSAAESTAAATARPTRTPAVTATHTTTPTAVPVSTLDVQADELNGLTITFWHPWSGEQGALLQNMLAEFNRTNRWGITVQATAYEGLGWLEDAVEAGLNDGTLPDMLVGYNYQALHWDASGRVLVDLNEYARDPTWGLSADEQADFYPAFWSQDIAESASGAVKRFGLPLHRSALVLYYNRSFSQSLGFSGLPDTTYELRLRACAAAEANASDGQNSNDGTGGWLVTPQPSLLVSWIYVFGGEITRPDGRGYQFNTPQTGQALDYLKGLQDSGCAYQAPGVDPATEFATRRALFYAGSLSELPAVEAAFAAAGNRDSWTILPFPAAEAAPVLVTYGPALMITRSETRRELAAWLAAEWLVYPPNQAQWAAANHLLPVRQSTLGFLSDSLAESPQWAAALDLLPLARSEPAYTSWSVMRWALNDAMAELFDPAFTSGQIPDLLEALDQVALEIFNQVR